MCDHPSWHEKITQMFSMHGSRNQSANDLLCETLKEGAAAPLNKIESFLTIGFQNFVSD